MLFYAFGMLVLIFAAAPGIIVTGFMLVGQAVGADISASWSLIAEQAPDHERGAHSGVAQILWYLFPVAVPGAGYFPKPVRISGVRWLFIHFAVLARALTLYGLWNLWAGYNGFFTPYLIEQNHLPPWAAPVVPAGYFFIGMVSILLVLMKLSDTIDERLMFGISAAMHVFGLALLAVFGFTLPVVIVHILIMGVASGFGAQSFFQLWSAELFPAAIRSTAQGLAFAVVRIGLGLWSLLVPALASDSMTQLSWILSGLLVVSGVADVLWAPRNAGKSLEQIDAERG